MIEDSFVKWTSSCQRATLLISGGLISKIVFITVRKNLKDAEMDLLRMFQ